MYIHEHPNHYNTPPNLTYIFIATPTPTAIAVAIIPASIARPTPDISSPDTRSLIAFINGTPGKRGIIDPTINIFGVSNIPTSTRPTPQRPIIIEDTNVAKTGILLIFFTLSYILIAITDVIRVNIKVNTLSPPTNAAKLEEPIAVHIFIAICECGGLSS